MVWEDEANARLVEVLVDYTLLGDLVQVSTIRPTKVTNYHPQTKKAKRVLPVWTAAGRRVLRRAFLKNHMGIVSLQREIQAQHDQQLAVA